MSTEDEPVAVTLTRKQWAWVLVDIQQAQFGYLAMRNMEHVKRVDDIGESISGQCGFGKVPVER